MITTPELIDSLAADASPVRPLRPPLVRAVLWLFLAALILALIGVSRGLRPDIVEKAQQSFFIIGTVASLLTGALAAIAALMVSLPDRSSLWLMLPAPALVAWVATIGHGCLTAWVGLGPSGIRFGDIAECFATLLLIGVPLAAILLFMLRKAAPLRPTAVTIAGSLAVAALTATGLPIFHALDATLMILTWNLGAAAVIVTLGTLFGRKTLVLRAQPMRS